MANTKSIVCLVTDRMNLALMRPYGCAAGDQSGLDRLVLESVLFDQYYASSSDLSLLYESFWRGRQPGEPAADPVPPSLPRRMAALGLKSVLLTDEPLIAKSAMGQEFDAVALLTIPSEAEPAETLEATHLYNCFETAAQILHEEEDPIFLWCHFKGFGGPWDYPLTLRNEQRQDEDDPLPYPGVTAPFYPESQTLPAGRGARRRYEFESPEFADNVLAVSEAMQAGMTVWDSSLEGFCDFLKEEGRLDTTLLVVAGARGFPLGEHGRTGCPNESQTDENIPPVLFYNEDYHMPLMFRFPHARFAAARTDALTSSGDLYATLLDYIVRDDFATHEGESPLPRSPVATTSSSLLPLVSEEVEQIHDRLELRAGPASDTRRAFVMPDSLLIVRPESPPEFFILPDDRFNVNDVADRCRDEVESLLKSIEK
ncbi:MAG: sulfatase-like hydrolase/transferase [Planctomycetia bacterium]|nr:sulfatase-like hydrolase/transferase [Planctomycetia bacterium]